MYLVLKTYIYGNNTKYIYGNGEDFLSLLYGHTGPTLDPEPLDTYGCYILLILSNLFLPTNL